MSATTRSASCVSSWHCMIAGRVPPGCAGPQHLVVPLAIERDQRVGVLQNRGRRTVVVFQPDDLRLRPILLESQDVRHLGAAPAVDRLIVVADDAQVAMPAGQRLHDLVLAAVRVLVLVDEHVIEPLASARRTAGNLASNSSVSSSRSSKSTAPRRFKIVLITAIAGGGQLLALGSATAAAWSGRTEPAFHRLTMPSKSPGARAAFAVRSSRSAARAWRLLLAAIANDELLRIAELLDVPPQNSHAQRVKRRDLRSSPERSCENLQSRPPRRLRG